MRDLSDFHLTSTEKLKTALVLTAFLAVSGRIFYASFVPLLLFPFCLKPAERIASKALRRKYRKKLRIQFQDFLRCFAASLDVGRHVQEAMQETEAELLRLYEEHELMLSAVREMQNQMIAGMTDLEALTDFSRKADLEEADYLVQVFRGSRRAGGDFSGAVRKCSYILQDKIKIEQEIELMAAQKRIEGQIITLMPALIILFLKAVSPAYISVLYTCLPGRFIMTGCLIAAAGAYLRISRITDISV